VDYDLIQKGVHPDDRERVNAATQSLLDARSGGKHHIQYGIIGVETGLERWLG